MEVLIFKSNLYTNGVVVKTVGHTTLATGTKKQMRKLVRRNGWTVFGGWQR